MNKEEIMQWINEAKYIITNKCDYDERGNKWQTDIYKKDGKLYSITYCNNCICHKLKTKELITYEPIEVKKVKKVVTETNYEKV